MISQAVTDVIVTSYDLEHRKPFFFKTDRAKAKPEHDWLMREAARATSAAPTYFEPEKLTADGEVFALCDGGVFANNPAMSRVRRGATPAPARADPRWCRWAPASSRGSCTTRTCAAGA